MDTDDLAIALAVMPLVYLAHNNLIVAPGSF